MAQGSNPEHSRAYNRRAMLQWLRTTGPASRTEIAGQMSLSLQAVSNIVAALVAEGLVLRGERRASSRGQPPVVFTLNPDGAYSLGFSVDQERLTGLLLNFTGDVVAELTIGVDRPSPEEAIEIIASLAGELTGALSDDQRLRIVGLGLALPGVIEEEGGRVARMVRLPEWEGLPIADLLAEAVDMPVQVTNDATAAALGELWYGHGRTAPTFFYVLFALGLGSSLVLDGTPHRSLWTISGRMGHIPVEPRGRVCPACGERGCLSLYTSLGALFEELQQNGVSITSTAGLEELYLRKDPDLLDWLERAALYFTRALVVLENLLDPDAFIFGGEMPAPLLDHLIEGIRRNYGERGVRLRHQNPEFLASRYGSMASAFGAATVPIYMLTAPKYELAFTS